MKTVLELRKELNKLGSAFMQMLYWYFSSYVLFASYTPPLGFPLDGILICAMIFILIAYIWNSIIFSWYLFTLNDTNNVPYIINIVLDCYINKDNEIYKSFIKYHKS